MPFGNFTPEGERITDIGEERRKIHVEEADSGKGEIVMISLQEFMDF